MGTEFEFHGGKFFPLYDPALSFVEEKISDEDFNLFHTNERKLFYRLVGILGRNIDESMRAVAFLLWLERIRYSYNAVQKLIGWPFHLVDQLANEIAGFLRCLERENIGSEYIYLHFVRRLCSRHIQLFDFNHKRIRILESVAKIVSEVCVSGFKDILTGDSEFVNVEGDNMWLVSINPVIVQPPFYHNDAGGFPQVGFGETLGSIKCMAQADNVGNVSEYLKADLNDVAPDDRTIFLTFSKG